MAELQLELNDITTYRNTAKANAEVTTEIVSGHEILKEVIGVVI